MKPLWASPAFAISRWQTPKPRSTGLLPRHRRRSFRSARKSAAARSGPPSLSAEAATLRASTWATVLPMLAPRILACLSCSRARIFRRRTLGSPERISARSIYASGERSGPTGRGKLAPAGERYECDRQELARRRAPLGVELHQGQILQRERGADRDYHAAAGFELTDA